MSAVTLLSWSDAIGADEPAQPPADSLQTIIVKSEKLTVESLIDRKVYTVTQDVQSTFGTLGDILSNIPSVDVDPTGIVSLRGDTKVLILIDGKPSNQFSGAAAGDNLQAIPAEDIERRCHSPRASIATYDSRCRCAARGGQSDTRSDGANARVAVGASLILGVPNILNVATPRASPSRMPMSMSRA